MKVFTESRENRMEMDKRLVLECISKLGVYIIEAIYFTSVCRNR